MIRMRPLILGTLAYAAITFPLAYIWHLVLFAELYQDLRFTTLAEPNVAVGFITIFFQGVLLAAIYPYFRGPDRRPIRNGLLFGLAVGAFIWSAAAIAHTAKHDVGDPSAFIVMEGLYFLIDFAAYGLLIGLVYRRYDP